MNIYELQKQRRSIRKFTDKSVDCELLKKFVSYARLSASAMNMQPLRYYIACDGSITDLIFPHVRWAGYLKGAHSPSFDERPSAYILFLYDKNLSSAPRWDIGAASHAIQLMAQYEGLGTCWMGAIDRNEIIDICNIPGNYSLDSLLAIGYPAESPVTEQVKEGDIKYYLDDDKVLHVPKLSVEEIIIKRL